MTHKSQGKSSLGMEANIAALLSYLLGFVSGIIFYALEKENKFVRFHAMQSIVVFAFLFVLNMVVKLLPLIGWTISTLLGIIGIVIWVLLMVKAYNGEYFKLPVAGEIAEKNS
ncbi:MAG: DUF4870 domain-containing protein [Candidatus Omnitrophica bacterium]|nr:DUF4870 domain-containing protein [Candidatus Omnitrophota bacterium]